MRRSSSSERGRVDTSINQTSKCDFCDVTFKSDLDVSRHLVSPTHRKNLDAFLSLHNRQDKIVEKHTPKNLTQVLQTLKVRNIGDLKDLIDRRYFKISNEMTAEIADELAIVLVKSVIEYESKDLPPETRSLLLDALKAPEVDEAATKETDGDDQPSDYGEEVEMEEVDELESSTSLSDNPNTGPIPRLDSTYKPVLAIIKTEPKE